MRFKPSEILSSRAVEDSSFLSFRRNLGIVITANYMYQLQLKRPTVGDTVNSFTRGWNGHSLPIKA